MTDESSTSNEGAGTPHKHVTRAKFRLDTVEGSRHTFSAVTADEIEENERFHKYTPSGTLAISIDNDAVTEKLEIGKSYYLDLAEAAE